MKELPAVLSLSLCTVTAWLSLDGTCPGHLAQSPMFQQGHPELLAQECQTACECLRGGASTPSLGSMFHYSLTCMAQKCFLMLRQNFSRCTLCPLPLVLAAIDKNWALSFLHPLFRNLLLSTESCPEPLLQTEQSGFFSHSSQERCSSPTLILAFHCSLSSSSLVQGHPQLDMVSPSDALPVLNRGKDHLL